MEAGIEKRGMQPGGAIDGGEMRRQANARQDLVAAPLQHLDAAKRSAVLQSQRAQGLVVAVGRDQIRAPLPDIIKPDGPINTKELFLQTVCAGRPEKGMPAWCALGMDPGTIEKIYSYVKARSDAKMAPGRPARREG